MALINKQKAIDEIRDFQAQVTCSFSKDWESGMDEGFDHAVAVIELMETEDAEPVRHGKWIGGELGHCTACGHEGCASDIWDGCIGMYCPNCGAKMDAQEKENE